MLIHKTTIDYLDVGYGSTQGGGDVPDLAVPSPRSICAASARNDA